MKYSVFGWMIYLAMKEQIRIALVPYWLTDWFSVPKILLSLKGQYSPVYLTP